MIGRILGGALVVAALTVPWDLAAQQIRACYMPANGVVYLIGEPGLPSACRSPAHVEISWNQQGPAGAGIGNFEVVMATYAQSGVGNPDIASGTAECPAGKTLISGGAQIRAGNDAIPPFVALVESAPVGNGWWGVARETILDIPAGYEAPGGWSIIVYARCATIGP